MQYVISKMRRTTGKQRKSTSSDHHHRSHINMHNKLRRPHRQQRSGDQFVFEPPRKNLKWFALPHYQPFVAPPARHNQSSMHAAFTVDTALTLVEDPDQYQDAMTSNKSSVCKAATQREYDSLIKNQTWEIMSLPTNCSLYGLGGPLRSSRRSRRLRKSTKPASSLRCILNVLASTTRNLKSTLPY
jgi:hypothetical protein